MHLLASLVLGAFAAVALSSNAQADVLLTRKTHSDAYTTPDGEVPAKEGTTTIWVGKDRLRLDDGERIVVVRLDQQKVHVIDPRAKVASSVEMPVDLVKLAPPELANALAGMARAMQVTSETTEESKRFGEWNARKNVVRLGGGANATIAVWMTKDLPIDAAAYADLVYHAMSVRPGGTMVADEMRKLGGVSVLTEREQRSGAILLRSRDELVSAQVKEAPAGIYDVPAGFTLKPFDAAEEILRSLPKRPQVPAGAGGTPR